MRIRARHGLTRLLPLAMATLVVAVGGYFVGLSGIYQLQNSEAEFTARTFAKYLVREVPDLLGIVNGKVTGGASIAALAQVRPLAPVFKFQVYDTRGLLKIDYSNFAQSHLVDLRDAYKDDAVLAVAKGRGSFTQHEGDGRTLPLHYSETMVPLIADNRPVGVLSVLSDETETLPRLFDQFRAIAGQIAALFLIAFGVPLALYIGKLNQLEGTRRQLRHAARHDALTGLLNRSGLNRALEQQLAEACKKGAGLAIYLIDLDRFTDVNDAVGQVSGDAVLRLAAGRLGDIVEPGGHLARLGADEFALVQAVGQGNSALGRADSLARHIASELAVPFNVHPRPVQLTASVGYALYPTDAVSAEGLLRAADAALHFAKQRARGRAVAFTSTMEVERQSRQRLEGLLRTALRVGGLSLEFQPVCETTSRRLRGFEALVRLADENGRPIPPTQFIPVAEELGLIGDVGAWVLEEACRVAKEWPADLFVAVNLSAAQFGTGGIARDVMAILARTGLAPGRLELEVTESLLIGNPDMTLRELNDIKALGASLALDDFGTGFSSLSYLWRFPFDKLKVDRSFIADLTRPGSPSREILSTIIALGRVLNLKVTAEGVETEAQAIALRELGCDLMQGYLLGRPMPATDIAAAMLKSLQPDGPGTAPASASAAPPGTVPFIGRGRAWPSSG